MSQDDPRLEEMNLAVANLLSRGRHHEALPAAEEALEFARAAGMSEGLADALNNIGFIHLEARDLTQARPYLEEALQVRKDLLGEDHPSVAQSLNNLSGMLYEAGDLEAARPLLEEAVDIWRRTGHQELATGLGNLSALVSKLGDLAEAARLNQEVEDVLAGRLPEPAEVDTEGAERRSPEELARLRAELMRGAYEPPVPEDPRRADLLVRQGKVYEDLGDPERAMFYFHRAYEIREDAYAEPHPETAQALIDLGRTLLRQGVLDAAEKRFGQAREILEGTVPEDHELFGTLYNHQAYLRIAHKDYAEAATLFDRVVEIRRAGLAEDDPSIAVDIGNLGLIRQVLGEAEEAVSLHEEALALHRAPGIDDPGLATTLDNLGTALAAVGRETEGFERLDEAERIRDRLIGQAMRVGNEDQRLRYLKSLRTGFDGYLSLVRGRFAESKEHVRQAMDLVLARKGIAAEALALQRDAIVGGDDPELLEKLKKLSELRMRIAQADLEGPGASDPGAHMMRQSGLEDRKQTLEAEIAAAIPADLGERLRAADRAAVSTALPEDAALVEFVKFTEFDFHAVPARGEAQLKSPRYLAFVLVAGEPESVRMLDLGEAGLIESALIDYRGMVTGGAESERERRGSAPEREAGADLRRAVFDPLVPHLGGRTRLFLSPDGDLTQLPFEVLPDDGGGRLIDEYRISYLSTGREVLGFGRKPGGSATDSVVATDPDFDLGDPSAPVPPDDEDESRGRRSADLKEAALRFARLPGTRDEGAGVATLVGGTSWTGDAVLEARLKSVESPKVLHLATHGFFLEDQSGEGEGEAGLAGDLGPLRGEGMENPLLRSGLALAGANTFLARGSLPPEAEDGLLTAEDVSGLDLRATELVVLSACETGLGEVHVGEGVFGLRRAFVLAGAKTLVMSLWKVPDGPSAELMQAFYENLKEGMGRAEALREAQRTLAGIYPPPWFWGAFICQGDPGPLELEAGAARRKAPRKRPATKKASAKKSPAKKSPAKKTGAKKSPGKKPTARPKAPPVVPEESDAPEPPAPPRSLREIVAEAGFSFMASAGRLDIPFEGQRAGPQFIEVREFGERMAHLSVPLPKLPGRFGRKRALRNLLRVSHAANYTKAVLLDRGQAILVTELPLGSLTPDVVSGIIRGLANLADVTSSDLTDEERWPERLSACGSQQAVSIRVDVEEAASTIPGILESSTAGVMRLPDGSILAALGALGPGPEVIVQWNERVVLLIAHLDASPHGDEKRYLSRLLALNGKADVAKVGLDTGGRIALAYEVPRLTADLLPEIKRQFAALVMGVAEIDSGG